VLPDPEGEACYDDSPEPDRAVYEKARAWKTVCTAAFREVGNVVRNVIRPDINVGARSHTPICGCEPRPL